MNQHNETLIRLFAVLGMCAAAALLIALPLVPAQPNIREHHGEWAMVDQATGATGTFSVPGLFRNQGQDSHAHVRLTRTIDLSDADGPWGLWIERPVFAAVVYVDGVQAGRSGDPSGNHRSDQDIIAPLLGEPGPRTIEIELLGDFGKGGIIGGVRTGPLEQILRHTDYREAANTGFGIGAAVMALLHLGVVVLRSRRLPHLFLGLFAMSISAYAFCHADITYEVLPDALGRLYVLRLAESGLGAFGCAFIALYTLGRLRMFDKLIMGTLGVAALVCVMGPPTWLYAIESAQDLTLLLALVSLTAPTISAIRRRIPGSEVLAGALMVMAGCGVHDLGVSHGLSGGESWWLPSMLLFVTALSVALMVQDAAARARHERLVAESADGMVLVNPRGAVIQANPMTSELLGEVTTGDDLLRHIAPVDRSVVRSHLEIGQQRPHRCEFRTGDVDTHRVVESVATPLDTHITLLVLRDVTRRRLAEQGLLDAARMETAGLLAGGLAHDLNNMLGALLGNVDLLAMKLGPEHQERLERMAASVDRASMLTRRLLTYSGPTTGALALSPVDMGVVLRESESLVRPMLGSRIRFETDIAPNLPLVMGAQVDLEQIFVNLIVNARDALSGSGTIYLRARRFRLSNGLTGVIAMVEDDGPGVPDRLVEQIWRPFMTTKPTHRGTGLGLAVAEQIMRQHGGRIWYESRPQGGARFMVALVETRPSRPENINGHGVTVLLVEDEESLLASYSEGLTSKGFTVVPFPSADQARVWMADHRPDILVTDVVMPGISGLDLAQICDGLYPRVPILLVSGFIPDEAIAGMSTSSWHRLEKPIRSGRLASSVSSLMGDITGDDLIEPADLRELTGAHVVPLTMH